MRSEDIVLSILEFGKSNETVILLCRNPLEKNSWEVAINQQIVALRQYEYIFSLKDLGAIWPPAGVTSKLLSSCLFGEITIQYDIYFFVIFAEFIS